MGNVQVKKPLDARANCIECGFYIRDKVFHPIRFEWAEAQGRSSKYKWTYNDKKGELVYQFQTPKSVVFVDVLHALGFVKANKNDVWHGIIQTNRRKDRSMLAFIDGKAKKFHGDRKQPEFYVDDGMLQPVELSRIRNLFPDPNNPKNVTFYGSSVYFNGANKGTIVYRPNTSARDLFRLALGKIGYNNISAGDVLSGSIKVNDWRQPILTFRVPHEV